jgi:hypothetical protein
MSTTDGRKAHINSAEESAEVRASIRGREGEVSDLIYWHLIYWHVPVDDRPELAQRCWLRALERTRPWDSKKGALITWVRWIVMAEVTHWRRRYVLERKAFVRPAHDSDGDIDHLDERGHIGRQPDSLPSVEDSVSEHETHALVRQMLEPLGGDAPGSNGWLTLRHYGEDMSYTELVEAMASEACCKSSKTGLRHRVEDAVTLLRARLRANTSIAEDLHASLA